MPVGLWPMADLNRGGLQSSNLADDEDLLSILNREAQEAVRRIADQLHLQDQPRTGPEGSSKYRLVSQAYEARRERKQFFDADLFGEPVWDLLLALYREQLRGRYMSTSEVAEAADVPRSTAGRWIEVMERRQLVSRRSEGDDDLFDLTATALEKLEAYMEQLRTKSLMRVI
jgi:DNA-binding MarR family transcriptional regulator